MYRRSTALHSAKSFRNIAASAAKAISETTAEAATALFVQLGIIAQAERENRRRNRFAKRQTKHTTYFAAGLNGKRAVARRLRQIAAGQLQVSK